LIKTRAASSGRYVLILMALAYAVSFVDRALVAVAGGPIKHDLGLSDSQFGSLQGLAFALLYCLGGIPLGWLADRADRRVMIAVGLAFWSAMTAICGLAPSFGVFFLARVGVGLGEACLVPAGMSLLADVIPKDRTARAVAVFLLGSTAGNAFALLVGGHTLTWLAQARGGGFASLHAGSPWRALFLLACPPGLLVAGLILSIQTPRRTGLAARPLSDLKGAISYIASHASAYAWLTAATACSLTLAQAQAAWIPQFYSRRFGLAPGAAAAVVGWMFLLSAPVGQWLGGWLIDRLQAAKVASPSNVVLALCCAACLPPALVFNLAHSLRASEMAYVIFNLIVFAATPAGLSGWQRLTPDRFRGVTIALLVSIVTLVGVGLGPLAVGLMTDRIFRSEEALGPALLALITGAGVAGCALALAGRTSFSRAVQAEETEPGGLPLDSVPGVRALVTPTPAPTRRAVAHHPSEDSG
jgi:MFS family permease